MTDAAKEQLSACLDGELPPVELESLLKRTAPGGCPDEGLGATLGRYAAIGAALRGEPVVVSRDFCARIMATVAQEPIPASLTGPLTKPHTARRHGRSASPEGRWAGWLPGRFSPGLARRLRPVAGLAVAASVAAVAILSVQRIGLVPEQVASNGDLPAAVTEAAPRSGGQGVVHGVIQGAPAGGPELQADVRYADSIVTGAPDSYTVPDPATASVPAFVPATRLTNYVVAHSEYSSPLGRRSVLTAVLADDDPGLTRIDDDEAAAMQPQDR